MWLWWLAGCSAPGCDERPSGPADAVEQVQRARADLAISNVELCVNDVVYGEQSSLNRGELTVRIDHVRADVFEAACLQRVETDGLPAGAESVFPTVGLPPGSDVSLAFARACGREAETQLASLYEAGAGCSPFPTDAERMVMESFDPSTLLPVGASRWESVIDLPRLNSSSDHVLTDEWVALTYQPDQEERRLGVWSLSTGERVVDAPFEWLTFFPLLDGVGAREPDGRAWLVDDSGLRSIADLPERGRLFQDQFGYWVSTRVNEENRLFAYDLTLGVQELVASGFADVRRDTEGLWLMRDGGWSRLNGEALSVGLTSFIGDEVMVNGRVWGSFDDSSVVSRSIGSVEPWRLESTECGGPPYWLAPGVQRLMRWSFNEPGSLLIERLVPNAAE